jgi:LacI family transcriptional regulator
VPSHGPNTWTAELSQASVPRLVLDRELAIPNATQVLVDNEGGAHAATVHLLEHGHRRVGCIAGTAGLHPTVDRVAGWRRALREAGLDPAEMPLVHVPFGRAHGYRAGRELLAGGDQVDALFVTSDEQAIGVLRSAAECGVQVPTDLAVCSFDGIEASAFTVPALSTIRQPVEDICRRAVEWLVAKLDDPDHAMTRVVLPTTLVTRGSCGCPDPPGGDHRLQEGGADGPS